MFENLRKRHGAALPVAVIALVVAVAFAGVPAVAAPVATTSANVFKMAKRALGLGKAANKRSVRAIKIARRAKGTPGLPGVPGVPGLPGAQGPKGDEGDEGDKGDTGDRGPQGIAGEDGEDGAAGPEGSPWTAGGTLPEGETETGTYAVSRGAAGNGSAVAAIPFPIPLAAGLGEGNVHFRPPNASPTAECPGGVATPVAEDGHLCVYAKFSPPINEVPAGQGVTIITPDSNQVIPGITVPEKGAGTSGAIVYFRLTGPGVGYGSWAVTAP